VSPLLEAREMSLPDRLHDVSLTLEPGDLACLVGPNGSGKTSLLHAIAGIGGRPAT
jgi:ABC-type cobalamin/Fe3+-siderophores transport system ATPase subunit